MVIELNEQWNSFEDYKMMLVLSIKKE